MGVVGGDDLLGVLEALLEGRNDVLGLPDLDQDEGLDLGEEVLDGLGVLDALLVLDVVPPPEEGGVLGLDLLEAGLEGGVVGLDQEGEASLPSGADVLVMLLALLESQLI